MIFHNIVRIPRYRELNPGLLSEIQMFPGNFLNISI